MRSKKHVKLPAIAHDGTTMRAHPLVWYTERAVRVGRTKTQLARAMGVRPQTLYILLSECTRDRNYLMPAERVRAAARFFGIRPYLFRPDLYAEHWAERELI